MFWAFGRCAKLGFSYFKCKERRIYDVPCMQAKLALHLHVVRCAIEIKGRMHLLREFRFYPKVSLQLFKINSPDAPFRLWAKGTS